MEIKKVSVALISGGSSGIGAATSRLLAEAGITVYAGSRRGTVEKPAPRIIPIQLDVNDEASLKSAVERIIGEQGHLDAVVCNAGNGIYGPIEGLPATASTAPSRDRPTPRPAISSKPATSVP